MPARRSHRIDFGQPEIVSQLVADLKRRIMAGEQGLQPGDSLPTFPELNRYYGGGSADTYTKVRQGLQRLRMIEPARRGFPPTITDPHQWLRPAETRLDDLEARMDRVERGEPAEDLAELRKLVETVRDRLGVVEAKVLGAEEEARERGGQGDRELQGGTRDRGPEADPVARRQ